MYHSFLIHSSADKHLGCFHVLAIINSATMSVWKTEKETQMYRTDFWTLWEKARVGCSEKIALKQVYYQGWNWSPAQVGCMRQVIRASALGRPRGMGWGGRREGGLGWGTHINHGWFMSMCGKNHYNKKKKKKKESSVLTMQQKNRWLS